LQDLKLGSTAEAGLMAVGVLTSDRLAFALPFPLPLLLELLLLLQPLSASAASRMMPGDDRIKMTFPFVLLPLAACARQQRAKEVINTPPEVFAS
jgi:hypothetical protein